jgi:hypothetical protein
LRGLPHWQTQTTASCFLLKTKPASCDTASQPEPVKLFKRSHKEQGYRHHCLQQNPQTGELNLLALPLRKLHASKAEQNY